MSAENKLVAIEIGEFIWRIAMGEPKKDRYGVAVIPELSAEEYQAQISIGQIVADAVTAMFPTVGLAKTAQNAVTTVLVLSRYSLATGKTENWASLIKELLGTVPEIGKVLCGMGQLLTYGSYGSRIWFHGITRFHDFVVARSSRQREESLELGRELLAYLRPMGVDESRAWLQAMDVARYQDQVLSAFHTLLERIELTAAFALRRYSSVLPPKVKSLLNGLPYKLGELHKCGDACIQKAIKRMNALLKHVNAQVEHDQVTHFAFTAFADGTEARFVVSSADMSTIRGMHVELKYFDGRTLKGKLDELGQLPLTNAPPQHILQRVSFDPELVLAPSLGVKRADPGIHVVSDAYVRARFPSIQESPFYKPDWHESDMQASLQQQARTGDAS